MADYSQYADLIKILQANSDKDFVKRIRDRYIYPVLDNGDGSISTHSMADASMDGRHFAYPTVVSNNMSGLERLGWEEALQRAMIGGNYIEFPTQQDANMFARNYKKVWQ